METQIHRLTSQPKRFSFLESCVNVAVGLVINVTAQALVFPWFGIRIPFASNLGIAGIFTVISIARSYGLRRAFNAIHVRMFS